MDTHKVMFIGTQAQPCYDRPNGRQDRVWYGPGTYVEDIPPVQAQNLLRHKKEFEDVTRLNPEELIAKSAAVKAAAEERLRAARAPAAPEAVQAATTEDLQAELERREAEEAAKAGAPDGGTTEPTEPTESPQGQGSDAEIQEKVLAAVEELLTTTGVELDETGLPTLAAVQEAVGFPLSQEEYARALDLGDSG